MEEVDLSTMSDAQKKAHMRRMKILQRSGERMAVASGDTTAPKAENAPRDASISAPAAPAEASSASLASQPKGSPSIAPFASSNNNNEEGGKGQGGNNHTHKSSVESEADKPQVSIATSASSLDASGGVRRRSVKDSTPPPVTASAPSNDDIDRLMSRSELNTMMSTNRREAPVAVLDGLGRGEAARLLNTAAMQFTAPGGVESFDINSLDLSGLPGLQGVRPPSSAPPSPGKELLANLIIIGMGVVTGGFLIYHGLDTISLQSWGGSSSTHHRRYHERSEFEDDDDGEGGEAAATAGPYIILNYTWATLPIWCIIIFIRLLLNAVLGISAKPDTMTNLVTSMMANSPVASAAMTALSLLRVGSKDLNMVLFSFITILATQAVVDGVRSLVAGSEYGGKAGDMGFIGMAVAAAALVVYLYSMYASSSRTDQLIVETIKVYLKDQPRVREREKEREKEKDRDGKEGGEEEQQSSKAPSDGRGRIPAEVKSVLLSILYPALREREAGKALLDRRWSSIVRRVANEVKVINVNGEDMWWLPPENPKLGVRAAASRPKAE